MKLGSILLDQDSFNTGETPKRQSLTTDLVSEGADGFVP